MKGPIFVEIIGRVKNKKYIQMKTFKKIKFLSFLFFLGLIATSCVHDDDYNVPEIDVEEPSVNVNTDITSIKAMYEGFEPVRIETGEGSNNEMYMEAYVVSSDESGNIYKQMFVQDAPENPTNGVAISVNATDLYTKYEPGRKIYLRVDGLYIGKYRGLPSIGTREGNEIGRIGVEEFNSRILRSQTSTELVPTVIPLTEKDNPAYLATLVKFENVQFPNGVAGVEHYANLNDTFSESRILEDCEGNTIIMRNSGFADFKNLTLPEGNGSVTAILSIFNSDIQIFIRDTDDVNLDGERCGNGSGDGLPFTQNFESHAAGTGVSVNIDGWTNINVNGGQRVWEVREFDGNKYAQTSAFSSNENPYEVWMVTNGVNIPEGSSPILTFGTKDGFYNGDALTVKISTNYSGNVNAATWTNLNATLSSGHASGYGDSFVSSGDIDLSAYAGQTIYIAFQYVGASNGVTTTYQVDNISIVE